MGTSDHLTHLLRNLYAGLFCNSTEEKGYMYPNIHYSTIYNGQDMEAV